MADSWINITDRTSADDASSADINQIMANLRLLKGGVAGTAPTMALETLIAMIETVLTNSDSKIPTSGAVYDYTGIDRIDIGDAGAGVVSMGDLTGRFGNAVASTDRYTFTVAGTYLVVIWAEQGVTQFILAKDGGGLVTHNLAASNDLSLSYPLLSITAGNYITATWAGSSFGGYMSIIRIGN